MSIYNEVQHVEVPRTYHHQPKKHYGTFETGYIIPIYKKFLLPNDLIKIDWNMVVRQLQMRVPSYSGIKIKCKAFSLAVRVLDKNFYRFMTGYKEYSTQTKYEEPLKTWIPDINNTKAGSLWDYMQFQINNNFEDDPESQPLDIWRQFYGYIWDLYFRNQAIQESILVDGEPNSWQGETLLRINNQRDYFTTALPFQQLGDPVGLPIVGDTKAVWNEENFDIANATKSVAPNTLPELTGNLTTATNVTIPEGQGSHYHQYALSKIYEKDKATQAGIIVSDNNRDILANILNANTVSFNEISSVTVSMLRQAFALQMFAEMQARGGIRDIEFLLQHFGTAPADETLQRPKYLGGWDMNILNSEVLQTSQNTTESYLGEIGGTGLGAGQSKTITHHAKEYEMIMILAYARTDTLYAQGIKREDTIKINTEFGLPVLGHISEQPIYQRELCACSKYAIARQDDGSEVPVIRQAYDAETYNAANANIIGYRPVYDWFRQDKNQISGAFHMYQVFNPGQGGGNVGSEGDANQAYTYQMYDWTNARFFDIRISRLPKINDDFLQYKDDLRNNIITEDNTGQFTLCNTHNLLFAINFEVKTWRPISQFGTPGRLDHIV